MSASAFKKVLVGAAFIALIGSLILAYLNTAAVKGLFLSSNGYVDAKYFQHVSPIGIAFGIIWPIIYLWNIAAILYVFISMFLRENRSPVNVEPSLISFPFLVAYILAWSSTVGWLFAFDYENLELSLVLLMLAAASFYVAIGTSCVLVEKNELRLQENSQVMLRLVRIFVQNGLGLPATWLTIATFINLSDTIIYKDSLGVAPPILRGTVSILDSSTIALSLLLALIIIWFILENFVWEKYCRYIFTLYPVLILGLSGLIARIQIIADAKRNIILASILLAFSVLALLLRITLSIYRWKTRPTPEDPKKSQPPYIQSQL